MNSAESLLRTLAEIGAGFVRVYPPGVKLSQGRATTGKEPVGREWQKKPQSLDAALKHLRSGGNVGLLCGHGGLVVIDADDRADEVEKTLPELKRTIKIFRRNAPERAKWIVRTDRPLRAQKKDKLELLSAGNQAVVAGRHGSGAVLEWSGEKVIELSAERIFYLFESLVGAKVEVGAIAQGADKAFNIQNPELAERVKYVQRVLAHGKFTHKARQKSDCIVFEFKDCPFVSLTDEPHRPHSAHNKAFVCIDTDGRIAAGCHAARCQHAIERSGKAGWALLKELAGYAPRLQIERVGQIVAALREWIAKTDLAEHVPPVKQSDAGYRTRHSDLAVALALLRAMHETGRVEKVRVGLRRLRQYAGLGSLLTVRKSLDRLSPWFITINITQDEDGERWQTYSLSKEMLNLSEELEPSEHYAKETPLLHYLNHDVFTCSLTPLTREELTQMIAERNARIANFEDVRPLRPERYLRRLNAKLPGAGRLGLRIIDALMDAGGKLDKRRLCERLYANPAVFRRTLRRLEEELCLVVVDDKTVKLLPDWEESVRCAAPLTPSAGRKEAKEIGDLNAAIAFYRRYIADPSRPEKKRERAKRALQKLTQRKADVCGVDLSSPAVSLPAPDLHYYLTLRRFEAIREQARIELRTKKLTAMMDLRRQLKQLRDDGVSMRDAIRMMTLAGWTQKETWREAWPVYNPRPITAAPAY